MNSSRVAGGCLCGAVRFSIARPARWVAHCHCSMCRRAHGAAFVTWVGNQRTDFRYESGEADLGAYGSSPSAVRRFCRRCGTMMIFESSHWPDEIHVTLASLDSADGFEPAAHAYWSNRVEWGDWSRKTLATLDPPDHSRD